MLERIGSRLTLLAHRYLPDPFVLAVLLTLLSMVLPVVLMGTKPADVTHSWVHGAGTDKGFWNLLGFGMQMCLILVTGHALAESPPMRRILDHVAGRVRSPQGAIIVVATGAMALALVNWGLGLVGGALLAREVGRRARQRDIPVHYPLLAAAGYCGLLVWHGGLSGSAPIKVTLEKNLVEMLGSELGAQVGVLPLGTTIGGIANIFVNGALLVFVPLLLIRLMPSDVAHRAAAPDAIMSAASTSEPEGRPETPASRLENSRTLAWLVAALGLMAWVQVMTGIGAGRAPDSGLVAQFGVGLGQLSPNTINFLFLFLGLAFHGSVLAYGGAISAATKGCAGIILQFPFYAGIMGIMAGTGLMVAASALLAGVGPTMLPVAGFYSAGLVNLFVPSGGGQWAVQGPIFMQAAIDTGVDPAKMVMALAYGDQWTNMLQPFWALPLLGITQVRAQDILGYTAVVLICSQVFFIIGLIV